MLIVDSCTLHKNITVWTKLHIIIFQFVSIWHDKCYKIWLDWMSNVKILVKIHLLSIICLLTLTCYILYFKKKHLSKPKYYSVVIHFKDFWFYCIVTKILKTNLKRTKKHVIENNQKSQGVTLSESVFQRFMGAFMVRYTCLIKKIIMCFKILFVCKFTVKRVKRITTKLWSLS